MKAMHFHGKAVTMLAKKTDVIMVSFEDAKTRIKNAKKIVLTGTPTRNIDLNLSLNDKVKEIEKYELNPAKPTVLIFGGSQGAKKINDTVIELAEKRLNKKYQILLSCGGKQYEPLKDELKQKGLDIENLDGIKVKPYIYEMPEIMNASDILVCRSGATTISEITNIGKPAIFVPLPNVSHDHQMYNAKVLENINAAKIIKNDELNSEILNDTIEKMLEKDNLNQMGKNAKKIAINDAEDRIYNEIKTILK